MTMLKKQDKIYLEFDVKYSKLLFHNLDGNLLAKSNLS
jgi:hypothetical protein